MKGSLGTATGTWVAISIQTTTWEGWSQTTDNVSLGSLEIMQTTGDDGLVIDKGGNVTFGVFGVTCTYGTGEGAALGLIKGGAAPELTIVGEVPKTGDGFLCPSSGNWTAVYIVTTPHELHIVS